MVCKTPIVPLATTCLISLPLATTCIGSLPLATACIDSALLVDSTATRTTRSSDMLPCIRVLLAACCVTTPAKYDTLHTTLC